MADEDASLEPNDDASGDGNSDDNTNDNANEDTMSLPDYLEEIIIEGLDNDDDSSTDTKPPASEGDDTTPAEDIKALKEQLDTLKTDKINLNKALHEQRQKLKGLKQSKAEEDEPLTDAQIEQIYEENKDDPKVLLRIIKHQAEQAAKKASGKAIVDSDTKSKVKEADNLLLTMYPKLSEEGSEIRTATDEIKSFYGIDENPFGDFFAMGVQVLNALPGIISSAEQRGEEKALNSKTITIKADEKRKADIKTTQSSRPSKTVVTTAGMSKTEIETAKQMNLSPGALRTYQKLVGKKASNSVQVKE